MDSALQLKDKDWHTWSKQKKVKQSKQWNPTVCSTQQTHQIQQDILTLKVIACETTFCGPKPPIQAELTILSSDMVNFKLKLI